MKDTNLAHVHECHGQSDNFYVLQALVFPAAQSWMIDHPTHPYCAIWQQWLDAGLTAHSNLSTLQEITNIGNLFEYYAYLVRFPALEGMFYFQWWENHIMYSTQSFPECQPCIQSQMPCNTLLMVL